MIRESNVPGHLTSRHTVGRVHPPPNAALGKLRWQPNHRTCESRYDGARARYLNRELDPTGLMEETVRYTALSDVWTDYDGEEAYGDYTLASGTATETMAYELGIGRQSAALPDELRHRMGSGVSV